MNPLNTVEIDTRWGRRSFELYNADITRLDHPIDVLAVSAFVHGYFETPGTVLAALRDNCGIHIGALFKERELDFRVSLGSWVSRPLNDAQFRRVICVEMRGTSFSVSEVLQNLFATLAVLETKGQVAQSLAMPILGAGQQRIQPEPVIEHALTNGLTYLKRSEHLDRILFVEKNPDHAKLLDATMDRVLKRERVAIPSGELARGIRAEILRDLDDAAAVNGLINLPLIEHIRHVVTDETSRSFEIGIVGRRLVEHVVNDLSTKKTIDLHEKIESLSHTRIAPWILTYMHVLRVFGNEAAHERDSEGREPPAIDSSDLGLCLFCLQRVLAFYLALKKSID